MAQDRLYLTCTQCGGTQLLAKHWVDRTAGWATPDTLTAFCTAHLASHRRGLGTLADHPFVLDTEDSLLARAAAGFPEADPG